MGRHRPRRQVVGQRAGEMLEACPLTGKVAFVSRRAARKIAQRRHGGGQLSQYRCDPVEEGGCGGWHNGHLPAAVRRGDADRATLRAARRRQAGT